MEFSLGIWKYEDENEEEGKRGNAVDIISANDLQI